MATAAVFKFSEPGSRILREWNERRRAEKAIAARGARAAGARSFAGAAVDRLTASMGQWSGSINADLDGAISILRARARQLCANNEHGRRFLSLVAQNVIGASGPTLQVRATLADGVTLDKPANDAIETAWAEWTRTADAGGRMNLAQMLRVALKGIARDGESLVRPVRDAALPFGYALQLLEPDRLDETLNLSLGPDSFIRQGVELNASGRPIAYHLFSTHPGDSYAPQRDRLRIKAADLFHVFLPERAEQVRGYTWLHAVLLRAQMLHGFEEAAVVAARVGASKMGVWTQTDDAGADYSELADGVDAAGNYQTSAEPGEFVKAPAGYKLDTWSPEYPHQNFDAFVKTCVRGIAAGLDVATHNLSGDMTEVNYSSARIAELAERETWKGLQEWFSATFLVPVFREWLAIALMRGDIRLAETGVPLPTRRLDKFAAAARFQGRRWDWVDPQKDAAASQTLLAVGLTSRTSIAASQGREIEDIFAELAQEQKLMADAGINSTPPGAPAAPTEPAEPAEPTEPKEPEAEPETEKET